MNGKPIAIIMAVLCIATPFLAIGFEDSSAETNTETNELREQLTASGYDVSKFTDEELVEAFGWFANKDLIGKYTYDDCTGLNWLLKEAGVMTEISEIVSLSDGAYSIVADGVKIVVRGIALPITLLVDAGSIIVSIYTNEMQKCALEKADIAAKLIADCKNYAVYETWVVWHTIPNGYEVEEW